MTNILPKTEKKYPCLVCKVGYDTKKDYKEHLKSKLHEANLKVQVTLEKFRIREEESEKEMLRKEAEKEKERKLNKSMSGTEFDAMSLTEAIREAQKSNAEILAMTKLSMVKAQEYMSAVNAASEAEDDENKVTSSNDANINSAHKFICEPCDFSTNNKKDYTIHTKTTKHETNITNDGDTLTCICGKTYKHKSSLCNHKKKCKVLLSKEKDKPDENSDTKETFTETTNNKVNLIFHTGKQPNFDDIKKEIEIKKAQERQREEENEEVKGTPEQEEEREELRQIVVSVLEESEELQYLLKDFHELKYNVNRVLMIFNSSEDMNYLLNEVVDDMMQKQLHRVLTEKFKNDDRYKNSRFFV